MLPLLGQNMQQSSPDKSSQQLTELFQQNLHLSENRDNKSVPNPRDPLPTNTLQPAVNAIKYSVSQHYHHSNHVPHINHAPNDYLERLLIQNEIAPSSLLPSQLALFEACTHEERQKLIMLWRLASPTLTRSMDRDTLNRLMENQTTTLEIEVR